MSIEKNMVRVFERGLAIRESMYSPTGRAALRGASLTPNWDITFNLGRGDLVDSLDPRSLTFSLGGSLLSLSRATAQAEHKGTFDIFSLKNAKHRDPTVLEMPRLIHQVNYGGKNASNTKPIEDEDVPGLLELFDADLDLIEKLVSGQISTSQRDAVV